MWVKLLMGDNNSNNITNSFFQLYKIILRKTKLLILQNLNIYFTQQKYICYRFNESTFEFTLN